MTEPTPGQAPAGWYPANVDGHERYWDGTAWTEQLRPIAATTPVATAEPAAATLAPPAKKPWYRRKAIAIPVGVVGGIILISGIANGLSGGGSADDTTPPAVVQEEDKPEPAVVEEPEDTRPEVPNVQGKTVAEARAALEGAGFTVAVLNGAPDHAVVDTQDVAAGEQRDEGATISLSASVPMTLGQENALEDAISYLDFSDFSRAGLTRQMTSEYGSGHTPEDTEFAIATLEQTGRVDWNAEAVEAAKSYLEFSSFSRDGLYRQLTSEYGSGFTHEQAEHALAAVGY